LLSLNVNNNNAGNWKMCLVFVEIRKKRIFNVKWLEKTGLVLNLPSVSSRLHGSSPPVRAVK